MFAPIHGAAAVTLEELTTDFIRHMRGRVGDPDAKRRRAPRTVEHYEYVIGRYVLPLIGSTPAPDVTVAHIRRVLDTMAARKLSPSTRTGTMTALSAMFRYGVKAGAVERNVVRDLDSDDRPGAARLTEPRYLTLEELRRLTRRDGRHVPARRRDMRLRGASRVRGARAPMARHRPRRRTLTVTGQLGVTGERIPTKTAASAATVPMLPALALELRRDRREQAGRNLALVHRDALVFTTATGKPQNHRNTLRAVHAAGNTAKLNGDDRPLVGLHDLRHSFVALALASGLTLPEASALARHANPRITAIAYAGLTDQGRVMLGDKLAAAFNS
jgi:integrase